MQTTNDLGTKPVGRMVLRLAIPAMIAQFVSVLYNIVDRMYIGNIPDIGNAALAGVGVCSPIVTLLNSFGPLVGIGGSILLAMYLGEKKVEKARNVLSNSFLMLICISLLLTFLFLIFKEQLLWWFGASSTTFSYANTYLTIYTFGTFFALMGQGLNFFITCQGYSKIGMATVLVGAVSNIILDPIFIFGFDLGVAGAAIATVAAQFLSFSFIILFLFGKHVTVKITFGGYAVKVIGKILTFGVSPFLILASDSIILIIMNAMLQHYGGAIKGDLLITCATITQSFLLLITGPLIGITGGTQGIIAYNYGAKDVVRVKSAEKYILLLAFIFTETMFLLSQSIPQYFAMLFTDSPEHIRLAAWGIRVSSLAIAALSLQYTAVDGLTALGAPNTALCLAAFRKTLYILATIFLPAFFSAQSIFFAEPIADVVSGIVSTTVYLLIFNRHMNKRLNSTL